VQIVASYSADGTVGDRRANLSCIVIDKPIKEEIVRKTLMLTLVLLTSAVWLQAQDSGQMGKTSDLTTIQGCLQYSKGHYRLTEDNGTTHQLQSQANKLQAHVGHTVELTGKPAVRTVGTTIQGAASSAKEEQVFKVSTIKHVADTCKPAGQ
jgi:ABC-type transport system involved in cytochrome c biogenesis ATPase subunit